MEAGYRFRLVPRKGRFFYDVDALFGYSKSDYKINYLSTDNNTAYGEASGDRQNLSLSLAGTCNYRIVKGLHIGVGLQPTYYIWETKHLIFRYWLKSVIIWALPNLPFLINKGW